MKQKQKPMRQAQEVEAKRYPEFKLLELARDAAVAAERLAACCYPKNRYLIIAAIAKHSTAATTTQPRTVNHSIASGTAMLRQHTQRQRPLLRPVLHRALDYPVRDSESELAARNDVAAVVNAHPDAGLRGPLTEGRQGLSVTREEIAEHPGNRDR